MPRDLSMGVGKEYIKNRFRLHRNVNDDLNCETIDFSHFSLSTSALLFAHSAYFTKLPISCRKKIQPQPIYYMHVNLETMHKIFSHNLLSMHIVITQTMRTRAFIL